MYACSRIIDNMSECLSIGVSLSDRGRVLRKRQLDDVHK